MAEAKRPDGKRRSPTSGPGRVGDAPGNKGARPRKSAKAQPTSTPPVSKTPTSKPPTSKPPTSKTTTPKSASGAKEQPDSAEQRALPTAIEPIRQSIAASAEQQSEQRMGFTARRAAILAAVVCVLTLTIAGPVRTYFAQRTEMSQLAATEEALRTQITELEQQKAKLADPAFIAAQARERLGFVMPGDIPYQVQLPPSAANEEAQQAQPGTAKLPDGPWYSALWKTIADDPHGPPPPAVPAPPPGAPPAGIPALPPPAGG